MPTRFVQSVCYNSYLATHRESATDVMFPSKELIPKKILRILMLYCYLHHGAVAQSMLPLKFYIDNLITVHKAITILYLVARTVNAPMVRT